MKNSRIPMGAMVLALAAVAIVACSKEKTAEQEIVTEQQPQSPNDYTLAEMVEAMSWEDGKAFFENQPIKDYTYACELVLNDCNDNVKAQGTSYVVSWVLKKANHMCDPTKPGTCLVIRKEENSSMQANVMGYFEDGKLVLVPITSDDGFTADGYLVIGAPIEVQYDSIIIQEGIYTAYYDEESGRYTAVAVDYYRTE